MIQYFIVAVIVLLAALAAAKKYLPASWRRKLAYKMSGGTGRGRIASWLDKESGCGSGCDTCGTCDTEPMPQQDGQGRKVIQVHVKR